MVNFDIYGINTFVSEEGQSDFTIYFDKKISEPKKLKERILNAEGINSCTITGQYSVQFEIARMFHKPTVTANLIKACVNYFRDNLIDGRYNKEYEYQHVQDNDESHYTHDTGAGL